MYSTLTLISLICAAAIIIYLFKFLRRSKHRFAPGNKINTKEIIYSGRANQYRSREAAGGYLVLTEKKLWFFPHAINMNTNVWFTSRKDIRDIWLVRTFKIMPNGIKVKLSSGEEQQFVVTKRKTWLKYLKGDTAKSR